MEKYAKEPISLAVDSLAILNQKNSTRQIDRNCHLELLILRSLRLATWSCLLLVMFCQFQTFLSIHAGAVAAPSRQWVETWFGDFKTSSGDNFRNYHSVVLSTLPAFRGLCLQACYHLINPNCRWLIVILNWFFVLYPKIAAIMKKIFLAFLTHPMLIANFFPFGFFPVELNSGLTAISNRIHCIPVRLSIFRWLHVTYIHMEGLGYHKGHHWSSTEVAPTLNDLPLEWVWNNTFFQWKNMLTPS